jgi:formate C-acetyltransferase
MPEITIKDISLQDYKLTKRVKNLKDAYFRAMPEVCIERPRMITEFHLKNDLFKKDRISILDKAKAYRFALENRTPVVRHTKSYENLSLQAVSREGMIPFEIQDTSLFAGSTTSKFKGVPLYPEFLALTLWPELWTISKRKSNPFYLSEEDAKELNYNIFPHWMENTIQELARKKYHPPEMKVFERLVFFLASKPNCISHTLPDFSKAINKGLRAIINEAKERGEQAADDSKREFYTAISEVLEGIISYSRNLAIAAKRMAEKESNPVLKKELLDIAGINIRIPEFPAQTFREGLTTVWICWTAIHLENPNVGMSLGRLDQVLYDLYRKDIDSGVITIADAIELLCCLWLKIGDHVPTIPEAGEQLFGGTGSNQAITIGGVDKEGKDAVNDLTYIMLRATELMKLRDPNLNARYYPGVSSREYLKRLCDVNINTGATPALHNDKAVIKALTSKGDSIEHARDYGVIGCVEPGSNGRAYGATGTILFNLTSVLELTLFNGRHRHTGMDVLISKETGDPAKIPLTLPLEKGETGGFDELKKAFAEQARWLVEQAASLNNIFGRIHQDFYPTPILSALFEGPMDKGKDVIQGGAVINSSGATIIGLADVADSFSAIQKIVFDEKIISFAGLLDALNKNFEGYEVLQKRLMNPDRTPKYGNEDPRADENVQWIIELLDKSFGEKENYRGGKYRVGYWTMTNHAGFGRLTKAMPNGRKAHENFTSGITPVSAVTPFLTKALNSIAKQPVQYLSNGVALNLKYTPEYNPLSPFDKGNGKNKEKMLENFAASVRAYFDGAGGEINSGNGGMEIQFNITTHDTFVEAVKNPDAEEYRELLVRVSGYTAYFKDLNPQMQKEIIDRTEYLLSTGKAVYYEPFPLQEQKP